MRFLFTIQPGIAHLHLVAPIAAALREAGHTVAFACAQAFCRYVEALGFTCFPCGLDWLESEADRTFLELRDRPLEQQDRGWLVTEVFADIAAHRMVPDLLALCRTWRPDLIVRDEMEFGACIVAEQIRLPYATVSVETFLPAQIWEPQIGNQLAYLRSAYGLPPHPAMDMLHPYLYLSFVPPSYQLPRFTLPPVGHLLRPPPFEQDRMGSVPGWLAELPQRPTVLVTLGTVFNRQTSLFQKIITALGDEPINVVITLGSGADPDQIGPRPDNIYIEPYIPLARLLPHCQLAITHGGVHTTLSVLCYGLPMLCIPIGASSIFRAVRCVDLGMGLAIKSNVDAQMLGRLGHTAVWPDLTIPSIRQAVRELLQEPQYRLNAQKARSEMQALPGPERAVELLTKLATYCTPQYNASQA